MLEIEHVFECSDNGRSYCRRHAGHEVQTFLLGLFAGLALDSCSGGTIWCHVVSGDASHARNRDTYGARCTAISIHLGTRSSDVVKMVVGEGIKLILIGVTMGSCRGPGPHAIDFGATLRRDSLGPADLFGRGNST